MAPSPSESVPYGRAEDVPSAAKSGIALFRQIVTLRGNPSRVFVMFTGLSGKTWETATIAHESHNDVRRM